MARVQAIMTIRRRAPENNLVPRRPSNIENGEADGENAEDGNSRENYLGDKG